MTKKEKKEIFHAPLQSRVSFPAWLDNERIIFSVRENGQDKAFIKNLKTDELKEVLQSFKNPLYFDVQKDRVLFTSTQNGVRNLYEAPLTLATAKPITNSATHVFLSAYDYGAKNYIFTELTDRGLMMKVVSENEINHTSLATIEPFWGTRYPAKPFEPAKTEVSITEKAEDYSAAGYLWPRYWLPFIGWDSQGSVVNVSTSGQDPLGKHSYFLSASADSTLPNPSAVFSYSNQSFWPQYTLSGFDVTLRGVTASSVSRTQSALVSAQWEIASVSPDWLVIVGANYSKRNRFGLQSELSGPFVGTAFSNANQTPAQISPESGWNGSMTVSYRRMTEIARSTAAVDFALTNYFSRWLPRRNSLMVRLSGRYSDEPLRIQNLEQTTSLSTGTSQVVSNYVMRGYQSGSLLGRNILNPCLEYRFPITRLDAGPATMPLYASRLHGAVVADGFYFDGYAYDLRGTTPLIIPQSFGTGFWNVGVEARLEMNIGYHIPLGFIVGVYAPVNPLYVKSDPMVGFGFQM